MKTTSCLPTVGTAALLLTASCALGPRYEKPGIRTSTTYAAISGQANNTAASRPVVGQEAIQRWWTTFHDAELDALIQRAIVDNSDLKIAASRVRQARAERAMLVGGLYPSLDAGGGYNRGHGSSNVQLPFGNASSGSSGGGGAASGQNVARNQSPTAQDGSASGAPPSSAGGTPLPAAASRPAGPQSPFGEGGLPGVTTNLYQVGFDATWELDVFGAARQAMAASTAQLEAAEESRRGVLVSLLGEVAQTYIQYRETQLRLEIARSNLAAQHDMLEITRSKFRAGVETQLDVERQATQAATTEAEIPTVEALQRTTLHALAFLTGAETAELENQLGGPVPQPALPPEVPVGVPSDLLRRRPDVRRAERLLAAATANRGVATAELFPRFSLTGALGLDSTRLADLPKWSSHYYSIIPGVSWPILDWGRARANVNAQNEVQEQALLTYENTVSQSLKDVEDALVRYQTEQVRRAALNTAVTSAENAFNIARSQFQHGAVDATVVLDAQRSLLTTQDALAQSDGAVRRNLIALYKALGGGWEI